MTISDKAKKICSKLTNSDKVMTDGVLLACHHGLTQDMFNHMHNVIEMFLKTKKLL